MASVYTTWIDPYGNRKEVKYHDRACVASYWDTLQAWRDFGERLSMVSTTDVESTRMITEDFQHYMEISYADGSKIYIGVVNCSKD